jgi:hypothetical protein
MQQALDTQIDDDMVLYLCSLSPFPSDETLRSIAHVHKLVDEEDAETGKTDALRLLSMEELGYVVDEGFGETGIVARRVKTFLKIPEKA